MLTPCPWSFVVVEVDVRVGSAPPTALEVLRKVSICVARAACIEANWMRCAVSGGGGVREVAIVFCGEMEAECEEEKA